VSGAPLKLEPEVLADTTPADEARLDSRPVYWDPKKGFEPTAVWAWERLRPGNAVQGPAIVESRHTTFVVEPGWRLVMDPYRIGILQKP